MPESGQASAITQATDLRNEGQPYYGATLAALRRLDVLLQRATAAAEESYGSEASKDPFRGLYVTSEQIVRSLTTPPGQPQSAGDGPPIEPPWYDILAADVNWAWLRDAYGLSDFELDLVLIALAPEVDLRYERLYAYLQDDVSRKRPSVDLALNLLCSTAEEKVTRRDYFRADGPLLRGRLLRILPEPHAIQPPLLACVLKLDDQVVDLLLRQAGLDRRLAPFCRLSASGGPLPTVIEPEDEAPLVALLSQAWGRTPLKLYFQGSLATEQRQAAEALAAAANLRLLTASLAQVLQEDIDFPDLLALLFREARLQGAILYLEDYDALSGEQQALRRRCLFEQLVEDPGVTIIAGTAPWVAAGREPLGVLVVPFTLPDFARRRAAWYDSLTMWGTWAAPETVDLLAARFRLSPNQIAEAMATAVNHACWRGLRATADDPDTTPCAPTANELVAAARAQAGHQLLALARKIEPAYTWDDIVLPEDALAQLREICQRVALRDRVLDEWGFDRKLSYGKGASALFAGPPGTGKTMAAEVIARELGLDLYKIDLSAVISKYIGETEKNLERIFSAATDANAILFFDEADALFGKRSEVRDSHDRYANIEIAYLLQRMEQYDGLAILATNLRQNLDEAFTRRLQFIVEFPFPDEAYRKQIWQALLPVEAPRDTDIDFGYLARQFRVAGGNIKNIVLSAAFTAAGDATAIGMHHLLQATRREFQKMGKVLAEADLTWPGRVHG